MHSEGGKFPMATSGFGPTNQRKRRRWCRLPGRPRFLHQHPSRSLTQGPGMAFWQQRPLLGGAEGLDVPSKHEATVHTRPSHASTPRGRTRH